MIPTKDKYPDNVVNPKPESVKDELNKLKEEATNIFMTGHQRDAIIARCNNYLNNDYGNRRKADHKSDVQDLKNLQETRSGKSISK